MYGVWTANGTQDAALADRYDLVDKQHVSDTISPTGASVPSTTRPRKPCSTLAYLLPVCSFVDGSVSAIEDYVLRTEASQHGAVAPEMASQTVERKDVADLKYDAFILEHMLQNRPVLVKASYSGAWIRPLNPVQHPCLPMANAYRDRPGSCNQLINGQQNMLRTCPKPVHA